ncbi:unnamed protein product [Colias eurytheme]|nr:unnamed protein product [Colias eurytheme]
MSRTDADQLAPTHRGKGLVRGSTGASVAVRRIRRESIFSKVRCELVRRGPSASVSSQTDRTQFSLDQCTSMELTPMYADLLPTTSSALRSETAQESTDNLEDELIILPENKSDFKEISGRRIVDIDYFFQQLKEMDHESLFECNYRHLIFLRERRKGLASTFLFECELCKKKFELSSDNPSNVMPERERVEINLAATSGMVACGIGYSQFEEVMSAMDIPVFNEKFYAKTQNRIFDE